MESIDKTCCLIGPPLSEKIDSGVVARRLDAANHTLKTSALGRIDPPALGSNDPVKERDQGSRFGSARRFGREVSLLLLRLWETQ